MSEATIAPPTAPAPSLNATPARPAAAPAPSKPAAPAKSSAPAKPAAPSPTAKVTNPFDQSDLDMERFAEPDQEEPKPPGTPKSQKPTGKAVEKPEVEDPEAQLEQEEKPVEEAKPEEKIGPDGKPVPAEKPGKTSPWKLVESYKQTNAKLQQEIAEIRTSMKPGELPKEHQEKFTAIEARNKELEDEIRYVNYSKSKEFTEQYQKPYEEAWTNAISDLKELVITNDDGSSRTATAQDLISLSNMPLGQARATAKAWFGDSADDVMSHRRTIRDLSDKQTKALEDAKTHGSERDQQRTAEMQAQMKARGEETAKVWSAVNSEAVEKYEFLRPVEGQTERNEKLEKASKFVDETFALNVNRAKTQEERDQIIRRHAALRNRAIGFSVLKHENTSLKSELDALREELKQFQGSEPTGGEPRGGGSGEAPADTLEGAVAGLARYVT